MRYQNISSLLPILLFSRTLAEYVFPQTHKFTIEKEQSLCQVPIIISISTTTMNYNFKSIKTIPSAKDMINIVLSKTQRKTPTVVHPGYNISRIRTFYMRKIKFCEDGISEKLTSILEQFPKVEEIHPFYGDLINVLYDKDHYKLALGHIKASKNMVENLAKDYLKLTKYADSLYRCKSLKKAALGRMCTIVKKISSSLSYLEEVRKHLARLPAINPFERTILVTGYPNVGKSSFVNCVSRANVEVQSYPFTTQALYVGHTQYKNIRFQVIDSPGITDRPLEQMNTIEMQSITALAHLNSCILYFIDLSEQCGYSLKDQIHLHSNIKPLFKNKSVVIVLNKSDVRSLSEVTGTNKEMLMGWINENNYQYVEVSTLNKTGTDELRDQACDMILEQRATQNVDSLAGGNKAMKNEETVLRGIYVAQPKPRDSKERPAVVPPERVKVEKPTFKQLQEENGGAGVFNFPIQEQYVMPEEWKYDAIPQIFNGKNIADYVDPDIWDKLAELEREEDLIAGFDNMKIQQEDNGPDEKLLSAHKTIQTKKHAFRTQHRLKRNFTAYGQTQKLEDLKEVLQKQGIETETLENRIRSQSRARSMKREKSDTGNKMVTEEQEMEERVAGRIREHSRSRSRGFHREVSVHEKRGQEEKNKRSKRWRYEGKSGETDRAIPCQMPRHLFSGKMSNGARDRR